MKMEPFIKKEGYYIYYERNQAMQEYMIVSRKDTPQEVKPEEVRDEALKNYRELVLNRPKKEFSTAGISFIGLWKWSSGGHCNHSCRHQHVQ